MHLLEQGIPPSVTMDIWSNSNRESFISFQLHYIDDHFVCQTESLGVLPFIAESHTSSAIM